ncbi:MAG: retropepsin-like domain-containing protein [Verrucomicrobia bacterium]|nr:retropepsin-like domain-containing protein [Verrucomicrobiota bacterium]
MRCLTVAVLLLSSALARALPPGMGEIPLELRDGLLWVKVATPQSTNLLNFLVDSGANVSVVDLRVARKLRVKLGRRVQVRGVNAQTEGYWPTALSCTATNVPLPDNFLAVDLGRLSQSCTYSVDGLLGADFFMDRVVQIDFVGRRLRILESFGFLSDLLTALEPESIPLTRPSGTLSPTGGEGWGEGDRFIGSAPSSWMGEILPLEVRRGVLQIQIQVNSHAPDWVRLDTGCASPLEWVVSHDSPRAESFKMSIGLAETRIPQAWVSVRLGREKHQVMAGLHRRELFPSEIGLLGAGFLSRYARVTLDAKGRRLILEPRSMVHSMKGCLPF